MDSLQVVEHFADVESMIGALVRSHTSGWIFRGQHDADWDLRTSLERALHDMPRPVWLDEEHRSIGFFKDHARLYLSDIPDDNDIRGWLGLMQHYRAPTRMLDWTESPFVGLFFAYEKETKAESGFRALWFMHAGMVRSQIIPTVRDHLGNIATSLTYGLSMHDPLNFEKNLLASDYGWAGQRWDEVQNELLTAFIRQGGQFPLPLLPPRPDQRMANQQAVFTCDAALDGGIPTNLEVNGYPVLRRIELPDEWRDEVLRVLRLMGITSQTIYPGLDGLGAATAALLATPWDIRAVLERGGGLAGGATA